MMRVGLIVVGLSALTIMELGTPPRTKKVALDPLEQLTVDISVSRDTLTAADRLGIHHEQHGATVQPSRCMEVAERLGDNRSMAYGQSSFIQTSSIVELLPV